MKTARRRTSHTKLATSEHLWIEHHFEISTKNCRRILNRQGLSPRPLGRSAVEDSMSIDIRRLPRFTWHCEAVEVIRQSVGSFASGVWSIHLLNQRAILRLQKSTLYCMLVDCVRKECGILWLGLSTALDDMRPSNGNDVLQRRR